MKTLLAPALPGLSLIPLSACAVIPDAPIVEGTPQLEGTAVGLDQPVRVGDIVLTPKKVVEDSRCPANARCVWAGRLIVTTRIDGAGWRDTADLTLGESYGTHGRVIALVSAEPAPMTGTEITPQEYRFAYESRAGS